MPSTRYTNPIDPDDIDNPYDPSSRAQGSTANTIQPSSVSQQQQRQYKYSTASMPTRRRWRKYCCISLLFLTGMLITMGISMLLQRLFFREKDDDGSSDPAPLFPDRNPNETAFPANKMDIDQACSPNTIDFDGGQRCREACQPQFFECCDPFHEFTAYDQAVKTYNIDSNAGESADRFGKDTTDAPTFASQSAAGFGTAPGSSPVINGTTSENNETIATEMPSVMPSFMPSSMPSFLNNTNSTSNATCSFETDLRGCASYAKCQALGGLADAARSTLPILCSLENIAKDPVACEQLCLPDAIRCCFAPKANCLADNFDICMDYAPCQNLRINSVQYPVLETAPPDLDQSCLWQLPQCFETCQRAKCCSDPVNSCLQTNFLSCLTYAACNNVTDTNINIPQMFNTLPEPTVELALSCDEERLPTNGLFLPGETCSELCEPAMCCYAESKEENCFFDDPLGCIAWNQQCQVMFYGQVDAAAANNGNRNLLRGV